MAEMRDLGIANYWGKEWRMRAFPADLNVCLGQEIGNLTFSGVNFRISHNEIYAITDSDNNMITLLGGFVIRVVFCLL
jgi:hypothetical protein